MSAFPIEYACDRCEFKLFVNFVPRVYALDAERSVEMDQRHFWCAACDQFSVCESLDQDPQDVEIAAQRLHELRLSADPHKRDSLPRHLQYDRELAAEWVAVFEAAERDRQEWRSRRAAPAKCLKCGAAARDVPLTRHGEFRHGPCGGTIRSRSRIGSACGGAQTHPHVYDVDGNLLQQGSKPVRHVYAPDPQTEYEPLELFFQPLDRDPHDELEKWMRESPE